MVSLFKVKVYQELTLKSNTAKTFLSLVHMGRMAGDIGQFNKIRPTFSRVYGCRCDKSRLYDRLLSDKHAGKPAANWLSISVFSQWLRAMTGVSEHNRTAGEISVLTLDC